MLVPRVCSSVSAHGRGAVQPFSLLHRCVATELGRWQRRCDRLTQLQRRIRFPALQTITVGGETYQLPLRAVEPQRAPNPEELEYLVGFFDGDGCVTMNRNTGHVRLQVDQNVDSADVLLQFRSYLGGNVCFLLPATGTSKAALQWQVCGSKMAQAAAALSRIPSMKQAQLLIAANGQVAKADIPRTEKELKLMKQRLHVPGQRLKISWPYCAGFFDAEGCITVRPTYAGLQLRLDQVNPCVLVNLLRFLHEKQLHTWTLRHSASYSSLTCSNLRESKQTLERLLANGLLLKQQQAELALTLTAHNYLQIRDAISSLNGLQGRYKRLDSAGVARAREIRRVQKRLPRLPGPEYCTMLSQLDELRAEHSLQKLITRGSLVRKDMRQSLRQGGQVVSRATRAS